MVATDHVDGLVQSEFLKHGSGETRAVSLVANNHDANVVAGHLWYSMFATWVKSSFENIAVNHDCARQISIALTLFNWTDIYN